MKNKEKLSWILYVGTFPPRECGIATFTKDLTTAMDKKFSPEIKSKILAMNKGAVDIYYYPYDVIYQINEEDVQKYIDVAKKVNENNAIKIVNIQHEFSIFGSNYGEKLIHFIEALDKPYIITFHSVIPNPDKERKEVIQSITKKASCLIVLNKLAIGILKNDYGVDNDIKVIPHGIHPVGFTPNTKEKARMSFKDKIILLSFGMIRRRKGYRYVIEALPEVIKKFPNVLYLIVGETHPVERKERGEAYRNFLEKKVEELNLKNHVKFYNKYMKLNEILKFLEMTDIYISSGLNPDQIVSGTLSYAMSSGRAVVSTPFLHAKDAVTPERGLLVEFKNPKSFADAIIKILSNPSLKENMERNAYAYTRRMTWPNVAESYMNLFNKYVKLF